MQSQDRPPDSSSDTDADGKWTTHTELAEACGSSEASAVRADRRRKNWRPQIDNPNHAGILVPFADIRPDKADISRIVTAFDSAISALRERAEAAERRADQAEARTEAECGRAEALQVRVEYLTDQLQAMERTAEQVRTLAQEAVQRAEAIKQAADAARRARGYLGRLRAAWRGE
jgi:chromosome segregation ATPase